MLPASQHFRRWPGEKPIRHRTADPRDNRANDRRDEETNHLAQPVERKIHTEIVLDQPGCDQSFGRVAHPQRDAGPERIGNSEMNDDGGADHAGRDRPSRPAPERD